MRTELQWPGQLLGYRSMQHKIREQHQLAVPRNLVYDMMTELDLDGLDRRGGVGKKKTQERNHRYFHVNGKSPHPGSANQQCRYVLIYHLEVT